MFPCECRASGANDYANCTKCKGPGSLLPGGGPGRAAPGGSGRQPSRGRHAAGKGTALWFRKESCPPDIMVYICEI